MRHNAYLNEHLHKEGTASNTEQYRFFTNEAHPTLTSFVTLYLFLILQLAISVGFVARVLRNFLLKPSHTAIVYVHPNCRLPEIEKNH